MVTVGDLSHLAEPVKQIALADNDTRIQFIRSDRWIGYPRAKEALKLLEELLNWPRKQRMPNLLIVGPTNNGKSMIVEKFLRDNQRSIYSDRLETASINIVRMQMPPDPSPIRFYSMLLAEIGAPVRARPKISEVEQLTLQLLEAIGSNMLIIDELHNLLAGSSKLQREFLNLLRFLGNQLRIPIVGVGTQEAYLAIRSDDQLENRFRPFQLPVWSEGAKLTDLLANYVASLPLQRKSQIQGNEIARYVLARTEGTIGEITTLLSRAAIAAIENGDEALTKNAFEEADYSSPTARRNSFERQIAT